MTRCTQTTVGDQICVQCDEQPYIAPVAAQTVVNNTYGWNSSAYSTQRLSGDVYTQFVVASSIGVVNGLAPERLSNDPRDVPYAFYCYQDSGRYLWVVAESGQPMTPPAAWNAGEDTFRIERRNGVVSYFVNSRRVYVSEPASHASMRVVCCLYASGDGVY